MKSYLTNVATWPFIQAKKILQHVKNSTPEKGYVLFETGYGPSGLPHIGTFAEVARTIMVQKAFKEISDIPCKLICFSDDMDALREIPSNIPNHEMLAKHIGKPLTSVPDPFGTTKSYGHYMNNKLRTFLDQFGYEYSFYSASEQYQKGLFDQMLVNTIKQYTNIMNLMLPTLRTERSKTYSPFMPVCPETGKILQVPIEKINIYKKSISYRNNSGELIEVPVTKGKCKLQWKIDFAMRWAAFNVDYEMYGKDHRANAPIYNRICKLLGGTPPVQFIYELFLDENGGKISKSKGNSISIDKWLYYSPVDSISLFMYHSPTKAKRIHFDLIPKTIDQYITFNKKYHTEQNLSKKVTNPIFYIHKNYIPKIETYGISFAMLLNLASVCNPSSKNILWKFIKQYAPQATPNDAPYLDLLTKFTLNYYNSFIKNTKNFLIPSKQQQKLLKQIILMLDNISQNATSKEIQNQLYNIAQEAGYVELKQFFTDIYQILLGQTAGPRLGSFFKLYGIKESIKLITSKL
jgi:lysyl-tRNA synthetase class 1